MGGAETEPCTPDNLAASSPLFCFFSGPPCDGQLKRAGDKGVALVCCMSIDYWLW